MQDIQTKWKNWNETIHYSLYITLKSAATKKPRVRMWGYSLGECLYVLVRDGLTLRHKTYSITQEDDDSLEWEDNQLNAVFGTLVAEKRDDKEVVFFFSTVSGTNLRKFQWGYT